MKLAKLFWGILAGWCLLAVLVNLMFGKFTFDGLLMAAVYVWIGWGRNKMRKE